MPNPINVGGVVGTDGVSPIYNADRLFTIWNMDDVYLGQIATKKHVPKVGDVVMEIAGARITRFIVQDINPTTLVPVFLTEEIDQFNGSFSEEDVLLGVGPGQQSDTYRVYLDRSVIPYRLSVDARLRVAGTMTRYCKIFKGSNVGGTGIVISRVYDGSGNFISENIPLELAATELLNNRSIKTVSTAYTTADLSDGELVTAVFYSDAGHVVSKRQLLVENTAFIRSTDAERKYITGITLKSPFLSTSNSKLIQFPINVPMNGLNLIGQVHYSNGEVKEYPVDGTRFTIFGLESYVATQAGQHLNLVLKYSLAADEFNYSMSTSGDRHISELYEAVTLSADGTYGVKLFVTPVWQNSVDGYRLEWYLYNLSRDVFYNVTPYVTINTSQSTYNPIAYGIQQNLSVSVNLRSVNGIYKSFTHTQNVSIIINRQGTERLTNWTVGYTVDQGARYGNDTYAAARAVGVNSYRVKLSSGAVSVAQWLAKVYEPLKPLYNPATETAAPTPTHFALVIGNSRMEYPIEQYNSELIVGTAVPNSSTVFVQFIRRIGSTDLQLGVAGMIVWHVDASGNIIT